MCARNEYCFINILILIFFNLSTSNQKNVKSGVTALSSTSNAFGNAVANGKFDASNGIDENLKLQILAEEEAAMNQFKVGNICYVIHFIFLFNMPTSS